MKSGRDGNVLDFPKNISAVIWETIASPSGRVEREWQAANLRMDMLSFPI